MSVFHGIKISVSKCPNVKKADLTILCIVEISFYNKHRLITLQSARDLRNSIPLNCQAHWPEYVFLLTQ